MNCYNCDKYLKQSIDSVLDQTYENIEIIFWDNQSTDFSARIVKACNDDRIRYFYSITHTPLGKARNSAIQKSSGEYIAFLDCDDLWDKDKLKISFEELYDNHENKNISLIYSRSFIIDGDSNLVYKNKKSPSGDIHDTLLTDGNFIVFSSVIIKRSTLFEFGGIDERLNYCEDLSLILNVLKGNYAIGVDKWLVSYRLHEDNLTKVKEFENNLEVVNFLTSYMKSNNISGIVKYNVMLQNSYRLTSCFVKNFFNLNIANCTFIVKKHINILLLFPFWILNKVFTLIFKK
jgi:glycosyltransferase involved in cell wall biosynthesis